VGAVILKPKKGRFVKIDATNASPFIESSDVRKFIDGILGGSPAKWSKLPGDGALEFAG
jgi:hypothetical protein